MATFRGGVDDSLAAAALYLSEATSTPANDMWN
jgi:hypothetical protein